MIGDEQVQVLLSGDPFKMREGKWIGAKFGFVAECRDRKASRSWLDIDWIRITK